MEDYLHINPNGSKTKDIGNSRITFDEECVKRILDVLSSFGSPFNHRESLVNLCSGIEASSDVANDLLTAYAIGESAAQRFTEERKADRIEVIEEHQEKEKSFYAPIKRLKLKTFKDMKVKKIITSKEKAVTIAAERSLFGRLLILAKSRTGVSLDVILQYSLSPIPWSIGLADGGLVKTVKSKLLGKTNYHKYFAIHQNKNLRKIIFDANYPL